MLQRPADPIHYDTAKMRSIHGRGGQQPDNAPDRQVLTLAIRSGAGDAYVPMLPLVSIASTSGYLRLRFVLSILEHGNHATTAAK